MLIRSRRTRPGAASPGTVPLSRCPVGVLLGLSCCRRDTEVAGPVPVVRVLRAASRAAVHLDPHRCCHGLVPCSCADDRRLPFVDTATMKGRPCDALAEPWQPIGGRTSGGSRLPGGHGVEPSSPV